MTRSSGLRTRGTAAAALFFLAAFFGQSASPPRLQAAPPAAGFRDFNFGTVVTVTPTGEKPESKLWWNDGHWWGSLWDATLNRYSIHRFDVLTQSWVNTGTPLDSRPSSKADALWDGTHLYVASHVFTLSPGPAPPASSGRIYRFSYSLATKVYTLDAGFPVNVNSSRSETLVLDKDSSGKLWVTWVEGGLVKVNRTLGDDLNWGTPFDLPGQGPATTGDDISSVVAFRGDRIGIMWSNMADSSLYFAAHVDGNADTVWEAREEALADSVLGPVANDHINLKMSCDTTGALYAVTRTSLTAVEAPMVYVLRRDASGAWSRHVFGRVTDNHTRPILCLDPSAGMAHVFAMSDKTGRQVIYTKSASIPDLNFPIGLGTPFIDSSDDPLVNNPTAAKQCVSDSTGILVLASDTGSRFYLHNYLNLAGPPAISYFSPAGGPVGTEVEVHGTGFIGVQGVTFNGVAAAFVVEADTLVRATVPAGASAGPIAVSSAAGSDISASAFTVIAPPVITFFTPTSGPVGAEVEVHGAGFVGVEAVAFNGTGAGFVVDADTLLRATVPGGASTGPITVTNPAGSDTSASVFTVIVAPAITFFTPLSGLVGTEVEVHGARFVGVQSVAFNGTAALFVVDADTLLRATVPAGASTGPIVVTSAAGRATKDMAFVVAFKVERRIATGDDDAEESAIGALSLDSSDLELVFDGSDQRVGLRFTNVSLLPGTVITRAYVQFEADQVQSVATDLLIQGQAADNPATFSSSNKISTRPPTVASASWTPAPWTLVGEAGLDQRTPDLAGVVQEIVNRPGWASGNAMVVLISGTGHRTARSYEGEEAGAALLYIEAGGPPPPNTAPLVEAGSADRVTLAAEAVLDGTVSDDGFPDSPGALTTVWSAVSGPGPVGFQDASAVDTRASFATVGSYVLRLTASDGELSASDSVEVTVEWAPPGTIAVERRVAVGSDDAEESETGTLVVNNGDLELVFDGNNQRVGLRFTNVSVPAGAVVSRAYVQFEADETQSTATSLLLQGEAADNPVTFSASSKISTRPPTVASVNWAPAPWTVVGEAGPTQRTPDLAAVVQEIVNRPGWASGNAMVMLIRGTGHRTARSYEGEAAGAALLHIEAHPPNTAPLVEAGPAQAVTLPAEAVLDGTVSDDGFPNPPGALTTVWSVASGPGPVSFQDLSAVDTHASFTTAGSYWLRLTASDGALSAADSVEVTVSGPVAVGDATTPRSLALHQNRPNPFAAAGTTIAFELPATARVRLAVYDTDGRKIRVLQDEQLPAGKHTTRWDGRDGAGTAMPNGLYFLRLEVPGMVHSRKMLFIR